MSTEVKIDSLSFKNSDHLWQTKMRNFIKEQPDRFTLIEGNPCESGTMFFCETYLEAKFCMAIEDGIALYADDSDTGYGEFIVCTEKEFNSEDFK